MAESQREKKQTDPNALSTKLLEVTTDIHKQAERRPFMVAFFKGQLPREAYATWLGRQWIVYTALEEVDQKLKDDELVGHMHSPELHRRSALEQDLAFWIGEDWRSQVNETPAAKAYADRIRMIGDEFPPGYVAHQWLRYLGNVLGQELLRKLVLKAYPDGQEGLHFYDYSQVGDPKVYLGGYHKRMNSIDIDAAGRRRVAHEGTSAFELNIALTDELAAEFGIEEGTQQEADQLVDDLSAEHP